MRSDSSTGCTDEITQASAASKDPELLIDAKKGDLDIDPLTGEELEKTIADFEKLPPQIASRLGEILLSKK